MRAALAVSLLLLFVAASGGKSPAEGDSSDYWTDDYTTDILTPGWGETTNSEGPQSTIGSAEPTVPTIASSESPTRRPIDEFGRCGATPSQLWLDVMFVVDSSLAMGSHGLDNVIAFIQGVLYQVTKGPYPYQLRAGIVTYARNPSLTYFLGSILNDDQVDYINLPFYGSKESILETGLQTALDDFKNRPYYNRAARQVVVVIASVYRKGAENDPNKLANGFKTSGGILITVDYSQPDGESNADLAELSSPGFNFTNRNQEFSADNLLQAFTHANCFCQTQLRGYSNENDMTPNGGCYEPVTLAAVFRAANGNCQRKNYTMPKITSRSKATFVLNQFDSRTKVWTGLEYSNGRYYWAQDDSTFDRYYDYAPWGPGEPKTYNGDCIYQYYYSGFQIGWFHDRCLNSYQYACEATPCSTDNYCYPSQP